MFQPQQPNANRGGQLGPGRLQNGKLGSGSGWGFGGMPMGGANNLPNAPARPNAGQLSNFAQAVGGSQPHPPLDLSREEFPSLSGTPQSQQQSSAQAIWQNPNPSLRAPQQRNQPQGGPPQQSAQSNAQQVQQHPQQSQENDPSSAASQYSSGMEDYRFGGPTGVNQLSGASQPQTGNTKDFPPLSGLGSGEIGQDRRSGMLQNASFADSIFGDGFSNSGNQARNAMFSASDNQQERSTGSTIGDRGATVQEPEPNRGGQGSRLGNPTQSSQMPFRGGFQDSQLQHPSDQRNIQAHLDPPFHDDLTESPNNVPPPERKRLADMTDLERFGLYGLLSIIKEDSPDHSALAVGQDLTVLGLDLNRPDNSPLYPTFGTPFVEANPRPIIPNFTLPAAYTVTNVPPLASRMNAFSDETLFAIFFQNPRDIIQEHAAGELYTRDWRWHKELQQWMQKDTTYGQPVRISDKQERGYYVFFDANNWRRERREFVLNYEHLDQRHAAGPPLQPM
ncbi:hypothetical protein M501DRAFT_1008656 [Patellaria atrata CBS 101060]|uniref:NOT2/NOT3/NOT5 C-terminal domain-containing protein n=1 Tax=Patellaria atrata CBS 101060 TaxID=1346257 RepID=A0A9P4VN24_9PEZI|nr:hypothetical protein M501DRAFT_1008656 [Patellaria atrata CBS 101060]